MLYRSGNQGVRKLRTVATNERAPERSARVMLRTAIVIGSTRPGRKADSVARWIYDLARRRTDAEFELVDIQRFGLTPADDTTPSAPVDTRAWAEKIDSFDAYVFVTPEYGHDASASLRNAIAALGGEWRNKAAGIVSYGSALTRRAVEQLRAALGEVQVADVGTQVMFSLFSDFENFDAFRPARRHETYVHRMLDQVLAWSSALKNLRQSPVATMA
jgi:NAD(P)H-dependent FMN reductase